LIEATVNTPGGWVRPFGPEVEGKSTVRVAASLGRVGGSAVDQRQSAAASTHAFFWSAEKEGR
jgi:hypothetical protein